MEPVFPPWVPSWMWCAPVALILSSWSQTLTLLVAQSSIWTTSCLLIPAGETLMWNSRLENMSVNIRNKLISYEKLKTSLYTQTHSNRRLLPAQHFSLWVHVPLLCHLGAFNQCHSPNGLMCLPVPVLSLPVPRATVYLHDLDCASQGKGAAQQSHRGCTEVSASVNNLFSVGRRLLGSALSQQARDNVYSRTQPLRSPDGLHAPPRQPSSSTPLALPLLCWASVCIITGDRLCPCRATTQPRVDPTWLIPVVAGREPMLGLDALPPPPKKDFFPIIQEVWGGLTDEVVERWTRGGKGGWGVEEAEEERRQRGGMEVNNDNVCVWGRAVDVGEMSSIERALVLNGFSGSGGE